MPALELESELFDALEPQLPCDWRVPPCESPATWSGTCRGCGSVALMCEAHFSWALDATANGCYCTKCERRALSLPGLWILDRIR